MPEVYSKVVTADECLSIAIHRYTIDMVGMGVGIGISIALYVAVGVWTQLAVNANGYIAFDLGIYLKAAGSAMHGIDPYQPFKIGTSFVYPPPALLLFAPLSALPVDEAARIWRLLSLVLYGAAIWIMCCAVWPRYGKAQSRSRKRRVRVCFEVWANILP